MPAPAETPDPMVWPRVDKVVATGSGKLHAIVQPCRNCATDLRVSEDDGASWQIRTVPPRASGAPDLPRIASLMPLGPEALAWRDDLAWERFRDLFSAPPETGEPTAGPGERTAGTGEPSTDGFWTPVDGGRTWRRAAVDPPVAAVPPGGHVFGCDVIVDESPCRVWTADPRTGHFAPLATQPAGLLIQQHWDKLLADVPPGGRLLVPRGRRAGPAADHGSGAGLDGAALLLGGSGGRSGDRPVPGRDRRRPAAVVRFLDSRPLRTLGRFSYSLYLIHLPVLALVTPAWAALPVCLVLAWVFAALLENPEQRGRALTRPA